MLWLCLDAAILALLCKGGDGCDSTGKSRASGTGQPIARVFNKLVQELEPFPLQSGTMLGHPRAVTDFWYFIESGIVSLVATTRNGSSVEVALDRPRGGGRNCRRARQPAAPVRLGGPASGAGLSRAEAGHPRAHLLVQRVARAADGLLAARDAPARAVGAVQPLPHLGAAPRALAAAHGGEGGHQPVRADARVRGADGRRAAAGRQRVVRRRCATRASSTTAAAC